MSDLTPETLRSMAVLLGMDGWTTEAQEIERLADAWEADIDRAEEAERVWFQEGYAQADQRYEADRKRLEETLGELLHAYAFDQTASDDGEHGEQRAWYALTDEQRTWWIANALEDQPDE